MAKDSRRQGTSERVATLVINYLEAREYVQLWSQTQYCKTIMAWALWRVPWKKGKHTSRASVPLLSLLPGPTVPENCLQFLGTWSITRGWEDRQIWPCSCIRQGLGGGWSINTKGCVVSPMADLIKKANSKVSTVQSAVDTSKLSLVSHSILTNITTLSRECHSCL